MAKRALYFATFVVGLATAAYTNLPIYTVGPASHYGVGFEIGRLGAARIRGWLTSYARLPVIQQFVTTHRGAALLARLERSNCGAFPQYCDELRGMADGAGLTFRNTTLLMVLRHELSQLLLPSGGGSAKVPGPDAECTDVIIRRRGQSNHSGNDAVGIAHNEDGEAFLGQFAFFVNATFAPGGAGAAAHPPFFSFMYPASTAGHAFGVNGHGVAVTMNALYPTAVAPDGIGCYFLSRDMLAARSAADALARTRPRPLGAFQGSERKRTWAYGASLNVGIPPVAVAVAGAGAGAGTTGAHQPARAFNIEVAPPDFTDVALEEERTATFSFHMNSYLRLNVSQRDEPSSAHRLRAAQYLCAVRSAGDASEGPPRAPPPPSSVDGLRRVLGDTSDSRYPLYRNASPPDDSATAATAVFDLVRRRLHVYVGVNPWTSSAGPSLSIRIPAPSASTASSLRHVEF